MRTNSRWAMKEIAGKMVTEWAGAHANTTMETI